MGAQKRPPEQLSWRLDQVSRHAEAIERERGLLLAAIRRAHDAGASLRAIAKAAGLSHQRIHQLLNEPGQVSNMLDTPPTEPVQHRDHEDDREQSRQAPPPSLTWLD